MLITSETNNTQLDADNQFQIDYLLEYIERLEAQVNDEKPLGDARQAYNPHIKPLSILSAEELTMLCKLFYPAPQI
ncbi:MULTISPECIES: hypothetical protein [unclassified Shewanella]|uniref:hypothetical protein n=1 Tax=unclassified Shewanella TaxID=196818 RepID=UPI001BC48843|nr:MULTISPECIES: hypothetical protein [unclassified Shewanella]GIU18578.1 hypothetical protein TUM4444_33780 [Shewanella sp. MBTL60-112-B1]GIU37253.1 hypothetical protein TUM4445_29470 [Shewanella sp. MBTL60-112-B2]